jgi:hypothetical protein
MTIDGQEYEFGIDVADIEVVETYMRPSAEYPNGSYMQTVDGKVQVATGLYATLHPGKPSYDWHGGVPFVFLDTSDWTWPKMNESPTETKRMLGTGE